jgi:hypothetical protein
MSFDLRIEKINKPIDDDLEVAIVLQSSISVTNAILLCKRRA